MCLTIYELSLSIIILGKDRVAVVVFAVAAKFVMDIYIHTNIEIYTLANKNANNLNCWVSGT